MRTNITKQIRASFLLFIVSIMPLVANAYDFKADGIYYDINSDSVSVTLVHSITYTGDFVIPPIVSYNGKDYTVTKIGNAAFKSRSITSVSIPETIEDIGDSAFSYCLQLRLIDIPNSVKTIGVESFYSALAREIHISGSVEHIGEDAFSNNYNLKKITVDSDNRVYDSRGNCNAIIETATNTLITGCYTTIIPRSVTSINKHAFYNCKSLKSATLTSVNTIGQFAFYNCSYIEAITFLSDIESALNWRSQLNTYLNYYIGENVKKMYDLQLGGHIYSYAMTPPECNDKSLSGSYVKVHVPKDAAAAYMTAPYWGNYEIINDAVAPQSMKLSKRELNLKIDQYKFATATLTPDDANAYVSYRSTDYDVAMVSNTGRVTGMGPGECDIIVTCLDFIDTCHVVVTDEEYQKPIVISLDKTELTLDVDDIENITPSHTPADAKITYTLENSNPDVVLARLVNNNSYIQVLALKPGEATLTVGSAEGNAQTATCHITVTGSGGNIGDTFAVDDLHYIIVDYRKVAVTYTDDSDGYKNNYAGLDVAAIPSTVTHDGTTYTVTAVGDNAFRGCTTLAQVTLPSTLESIGNLAFYKCTALTAISVPASVKQISGTAFGSCSGLGSIAVAAGNPVYDSREGCNAIIETATGTLVSGCKNTVVPSSVTAIGNDAFSGHSGLSAIDLPPSITSIGNGAFYSCTSLSRFVIPEHVESVGNNAFRLCGKLASVRLPSSVTTIGNGAFSNCASLATATLCSGIAHIGDNAFSGDKKLEKVICSMPSPESITYGTGIFTSVPVGTCRLFVPDNAVDSYRAVSPWSDFLNIGGLNGLADLTGDGAVNVGDISELYRLILNGESPADADLNLDGQVNAGDVSTLYGIILSQ